MVNYSRGYPKNAVQPTGDGDKDDAVIDVGTGAHTDLQSFLKSRCCGRTWSVQQTNINTKRPSPNVHRHNRKMRNSSSMGKLHFLDTVPSAP